MSSQSPPRLATWLPQRFAASYQTLRGHAGRDALWVAAYFTQNLICVLIGATWVARRWPRQGTELA
jgi:hypothetical protein